MQPPSEISGLYIYQIKVALQHIQPPVWRRIEVRGDVSLLVLHRVIQASMGWQDCHLHQFMIGEKRFAIPDEDDEFSEEHLDERKFSLRQVAPVVGSTILYEYDFGDCWVHKIEVEEIRPLPVLENRPVCTAGQQACPPEDVGGEGGYAIFLEAIRDVDHPEHEQYAGWLGYNFDPAEFNLDKVNRRLGLLRIKPTGKKRK